MEFGTKSRKPIPNLVGRQPCERPSVDSYLDANIANMKPEHRITRSTTIRASQKACDMTLTFTAGTTDSLYNIWNILAHFPAIKNEDTLPEGVNLTQVDCLAGLLWVTMARARSEIDGSLPAQPIYFRTGVEREKLDSPTPTSDECGPQFKYTTCQSTVGNLYLPYEPRGQSSLLPPMTPRKTTLIALAETCEDIEFQLTTRYAAGEQPCAITIFVYAVVRHILKIREATDGVNDTSMQLDDIQDTASGMPAFANAYGIDFTSLKTYNAYHEYKIKSSKTESIKALRSCGGIEGGANYKVALSLQKNIAMKVSSHLKELNIVTAAEIRE